MRPDAVVAGFWLKRAVRSQRFTKVEHIERQDWVYQLLLRSEADLDDELRELADGGLRGRATTHIGDADRARLRRMVERRSVLSLRRRAAGV